MERQASRSLLGPRLKSLAAPGRVGCWLVGGALATAAVLALLLRGCGPYYLNLSPGTDSGSAVAIATDHAEYRTTDALQVTVTNHLSAPIYTVRDGSRCAIILVLEVRTGQNWQTTGYRF